MYLQCVYFKYVFVLTLNLWGVFSLLICFLLIPANALVIDPNDFVKRTQIALNDL